MLSQTYGAGHHVARGLGEARMFEDARITKGFSFYGNRQTTCILAEKAHLEACARCQQQSV
jgi:hypothetical protein